MKKITKTLIMETIMFLFFQLLFTGGAYSQKGWDWMPLWERSVLDSVMNIYYIHNEKVNFDTVFIDREKKIIDKINLTSDDGRIMTRFDFSQPFTRDDSIRAVSVSSAHVWDRVNREHIWKAIEFLNAEHDDVNDNWKKYVSYLSNSEAKTKFNADTAIYFSLQKNPFSGSKYEKSDVLIIHKKDRGCLAMFFLYNTDSKEKLNDYITAMERSIKYGDESPVKTNIALPPGIVEVFAFPTQQKNQIIK